MMHHIGGDLEHVPTLFQPRILKTFSQIWETDFELCDVSLLELITVYTYSCKEVEVLLLLFKRLFKYFFILQ